jgi:hypothetical protein
MGNNYIEFCQKLFEDWKKYNLNVNEVSKRLFQLEHVPDPYLNFKISKNPLYILNINPGSGMDELQLRDKINEKKYNDVANRFGEFYLSENFKKAGAAYRRNIRALQIASDNGFDGFVNLETIPFHSNTLNKSLALIAVKEDPFLVEYITFLKEYLSDRCVLVVAACSSKESITKETITNNNWLNFQRNCIGLNIKTSKLTPLVTKNNKVTAAIISDKNKHILLMMGSNNFPAITIKL